MVNSARMQVTSLIIAELGYYHGAHFCLLLGCGSKRAGLLPARGVASDSMSEFL